MLEEEFDTFENYCEIKNASYSEDQAEFECTFRTTSSNASHAKINIYAFSELKTTPQSSIDFGRIKLIKGPFPLGTSFEPSMAG